MLSTVAHNYFTAHSVTNKLHTTQFSLEDHRQSQACCKKARTITSFFCRLHFVTNGNITDSAHSPTHSVVVSCPALQQWWWLPRNCPWIRPPKCVPMTLAMWCSPERCTLQSHSPQCWSPKVMLTVSRLRFFGAKESQSWKATFPMWGCTQRNVRQRGAPTEGIIPNVSHGWTQNHASQRGAIPEGTTSNVSHKCT